MHLLGRFFLDFNNLVCTGKNPTETELEEVLKEFGK